MVLNVILHTLCIFIAFSVSWLACLKQYDHTLLSVSSIEFQRRSSSRCCLEFDPHHSFVHSRIVFQANTGLITPREPLSKYTPHRIHISPSIRLAFSLCAFEHSVLFIVHFTSKHHINARHPTSIQKGLPCPRNNSNGQLPCCRDTCFICTRSASVPITITQTRRKNERLIQFY